MKKALLIVLSAYLLQAQQNEMYKLSTIVPGLKSKRISSYDTSGGNNDRIEHIKPGEKRVLANIKGSGYINHIWITSSFWQKGKNGIVIRMYWDDSPNPSVEAPLGYFFGQGWNENYTYASTLLSASPKEGNALVSYFTMPFKTGARIEIENEMDNEIEAFYYYVDYVETEKPDPNAGYFHAFFNMETTPANEKGENEWSQLTPYGVEYGNNKTAKNNYLIAETKGKGQYVGVNYYVNNPSPMWYGEGDDMIFIDDDKKPRLQGTGTEDYFNTSWSPNELYNHPYFGYAKVPKESGWMGMTHVYRYHISDPIRFNDYFKFTIEHGHNNCLTLQLASVAYYYVDKPTKLPKPLPSKEVRAVKRLDYVNDVFKWRHEWRKSKGNNKDLWGNEK